jgi:hypothetical protein
VWGASTLPRWRRRVHGGTHKQGIRISKGHEEGLAEMDKLSEFAPLHVSAWQCALTWL